VTIQQWAVAGLPNDNLSIENGIIIDKARRWALMIDPQRQANKFIKNYGKAVNEAGIDACKLSEPNMLKLLEIGIQFGKWMLLENIGEELEAALEPVLLQQKIKDGGGFVIRLGDKTVTYMDTFRFFMTTTLPNPHYSPETSVKVTLLNFAITPDGLEDQMLGIVVAKEQPEMEEKKQNLVKENALMQKQLKDLEDKILELLSADGNILESKELIATLEVSKETSTQINAKMKEAKVTEKEIDEARISYKDYAARASLLFFTVTAMNVIDPMYQFSLQWFQQLAGMGIDNAPPGENHAERLFNLIDFFTYMLYGNVCRGLFEKHKLLFSFSLCLRIMQGQGKVDGAELRFLLTGPTAEAEGPANPAPTWIGTKEWNEVLTVSQLPAFTGLDAAFVKKATDFKPIYDTPEAHEVPLPGDWNSKLTPLQKICFLRTLRGDKVVDAVLQFVSGEIGQRFVEPPTFDIAVSYKDSTNLTPLIFVLVSGSDPVADMLAFADSMNMSKKLESISLGQGQGPKAQRLIDNARKEGGWVLLCNCHLAISWLPELERICEMMTADETNADFRLWLTSMPTKAFPALLLQNGVKMTNEPPKGLRANMIGSFSKLDDKTLADSKNPAVFRQLCFGFCFFHAVCQERRKFGPIGWNIAYGFTMEDLVTCRRQLQHFINAYDYVPYKVLNYLGAAINYGGRVTDDKDKRLISAILKVYVTEELPAKGEGYKFSASGNYYCPNAESQEDFLTFLRTLPLTPSPEVFGLHENCNISCAQAETNLLLEGILNMAPREGGGGGGKSAEEVMEDMAAAAQDQTPELFDMEIIENKYPTDYHESSNTVLKQEVFKYNRLISVMRAQLPQFRKALKGFVVMSEELENLGNGLFTNQVPDKWNSVGYLSLMPLSSWIKDLLQRVKFMTLWIEGGVPKAIWISGFFFPQAYLTGALQNYARKHAIAIDKLSFGFTIRDDYKTDASDVDERAPQGAYCFGVFLEGCRWDSNLHILAPSQPKILYVEFPVIHFVPIENRKTPSGVYMCPLYKVLSRKGTLSTTGHSTNFVLFLEIPARESQDIWIRAGVAGFLALNY
jgi:dynein heavy chain